MTSDLDHTIKVDAIITCYNEPVENINITIASCLNQLYSFNKIFVIDDCSSVSPEPHLLTDTRICFFRLDKNCGISAARNFALNISTTPFIAIVNVDIELEMDWVLKLSKSLMSNNNIGAVFGKLIPFSNSIVTKWRMRFHEQHYFNISGEANFAPGHAVLFDKAKLMSIGFYNEQLKLVHEDADICFRLKDKGHIIFYSASASTISHQLDTLKLLSRKHFTRLTFGKNLDIKYLLFIKTWLNDFSIRVARNIIMLRWHFLPIDFIISFRCLSFYFKNKLN